VVKLTLRETFRYKEMEREGRKNTERKERGIYVEEKK
jgi:hypothetical protein